jgi:hypothetical protein
VPGYERWAKHSREWVEEKRTSRPTDQLRALNVGAKAAFESLSRRYDSMERQREENVKAQQEKDKAMDEKLSTLQNTVNALENGMASIMLLLQQQGNNNPQRAAAAAAPVAAAPQEGTCVIFVIYLYLYLKILPISIVLSLAPPPPPPPPANVNECLMATPRAPIINTRMPKTFSQLLIEWENRGLESFRDTVFSANNRATGQAYKKRKYLFDKIVERCVDHNLPTLSRAAKSLDEESRRGDTLANRYKTLHASDDKIVRRRKKRARGDETPPRRQDPPCLPRPPPAAARAPRAAARAPRAAATTRTRRPPIGNWRASMTPYQQAEERRTHRMMFPGRPGGQWEASGHTSGNRFGQDNEY